MLSTAKRGVGKQARSKIQHRQKLYRKRRLSMVTNITLVSEEDIDKGKLITKGLISEFINTPGLNSDESERDNLYDVNSNRSVMYARECPKCRGSHGVLWKVAPASIVISDNAPGAVYLKRHLNDDDDVSCMLCGHEGSFDEWGPHESLKKENDSWFKVGDTVLALKRRKGTGRELVMDLHYYHAKKGVDGVARWCIGEKLESNLNQEAARQIARHIHARFTSSPIKHREKVRTTDFVATEALESI